MKKSIFTLMFILMALGASAQVTWNVRAGAGLASGNETNHLGFAPRLSLQSNIPFSPNGLWVFSPSVGVSVGTQDRGPLIVDVPLLLGCKIGMGRTSVFIPKIGPVFGLEANSSSPIVGPAAEFAFEFNHFIVALSGYYSITKSKIEKTERYYSYTYTKEKDISNVAITFGYKF